MSNRLKYAGIERTADYIFNLADEIVREETGGRCWVDSVEVFEHDENSAIVTRK